jgi:PAS domain S-box-containing protein
MNPVRAGISVSATVRDLVLLKPFLALGASGWGVSDTLRFAGGAALIFVAVIVWVILLKLRGRRQNELLKAQLQRERALSDLGRKLAVATGAPEAARIILDAADRFFGWDAAYLNLYSAKEDLLEPVLNFDSIDGKRTEVTFGYPAGKPTAMARKIIEQGAILVTRVSKNEVVPDLQPFGDKTRPSASLMFVPIHGSSEVIGVVSIQSYTPGYYDEQQLALLQGLANHCGGALERINARSELTKLSTEANKGRSDLEKLVEERTAKLTKAVEALEREVGVRREAEARSAVFSRLGGQLMGAADFRAAGMVILDAAEDLLGWDASFIHLYKTDYSATIPILAFDVVDDKRTEVFYLDNDITPRDRRTIEHGAEMVEGPPATVQAQLMPFGVCSRAAAVRLYAPIRNRGRVIGAISTQSYNAGAYLQDDLALLQALADFCGGTLERIEAEQRLRQSEERFSKVFRLSPAPMSVTTLEQGTYLDVNDSLTDLLGYTREEMLGKTSIQLGIWPDPEDRIKMADLVLAKKSVRNFRCPLRTKSGEIRSAIAAIERLEFVGEQNVILATFHDVTESLSLEAQLRQSQKMEAIGQLAAGVAHDFNNILTIIQGHVGLLLDEPDLPANIRDSLTPVATAADRAASLTRQLLAFSRKQVLQMQSLDLNDLVSDTGKMLQRLLGETIVLSFSYSSAPAWVRGDAAMLEQVIVNLGVNARDAMPGGGKLRLIVERKTHKGNTTDPNAAGDSTEFVCLTISDTGQGMDEATKARIFEPFFTTKDMGRGTGLGLATVYGIVKQHCGWIDVDSAPGQGTTFRIHLPAALGELPVEKAPKVEAKPAPELRAVKGGETILVVEDEEDLRELVDSLLQTFGYKVLLAAHGKEAKDVWQKAGGRIDLVLTDITMPEGISGLDLAECFRKDKPTLKVIFSSGYSVELFQRQNIAGLKEGVNFLPKPYQPETLANTVRRCLDS